MKPVLFEDFTLITTPNLVTIGVFDGVHLGHKKVLEHAMNEAQKQGLTLTIVSFYPHPKKVVSKYSAPALLNTIEERIEKLKAFQPDYLIIKKFSNELAKLSVNNFIEKILIHQLNTKALVMGHNQRIGSDRLSATDLDKLGKEQNMDIILVNEHLGDDISVSSSAIRRLLYEGEIQSANRLLGYPYTLIGRVVQGSQLGRTIGFPTANLSVEDQDKLMPKQGVYLIKTTIDGNLHYGMMNIGIKPTMGPNKTISVEVHLFEVSIDLYHWVLEISLLAYLREEKKFNSPEELKRQLKKDQAMCLKKIKDRNLEF